MPTIPRNRTHLAELLGIAKSAVTAQATRGMPTDSLEAAQAWRKRNIDPARMKGNRFDAHYQRRPVQTPARPSATPEPAWFELAALALDLAELVLESGQSIDPLVPTLRLALHCVPEHERAALPLPVAVIKLLVAPVLDALPDRAANPVNDDNTPFYVTGNAMSEADAQEMGRFWYSVAAGEVRLA